MPPVSMQQHPGLTRRMPCACTHRVVVADTGDIDLVRKYRPQVRV